MYAFISLLERLPQYFLIVSCTVFYHTLSNWISQLTIFSFFITSSPYLFYFSSAVLTDGKAFPRYHSLLEEKNILYADFSTPEASLLLDILPFKIISGDSSVLFCYQVCNCIYCFADIFIIATCCFNLNADIGFDTVSTDYLYSLIVWYDLLYLNYVSIFL